MKKAGAEVYIYVLTDPRNHEVRYVGKTVRLGYRFWCHMNDKSTCMRSQWIRSLKYAGQVPVMEVVEISNRAEWVEAEQFWIAYFKFLGARLTNHTIGGEGLLGLVRTDEHRANISKALTGYKHGDDFKAKMSAIVKGRKASEDACRNISEGQKNRTNRLPPTAESIKKRADKIRGIPLSPEHRAKLRACNLGKVVSEESRRKMSVAKLGTKRPHTEETKRKIREALKLRAMEQKHALANN